VSLNFITGSVVSASCPLDRRCAAKEKHKDNVKVKSHKTHSQNFQNTNRNLQIFPLQKSQTNIQTNLQTNLHTDRENLSRGHCRTGRRGRGRGTGRVGDVGVDRRFRREEEGKKKRREMEKKRQQPAVKCEERRRLEMSES
jgi:hypothetical protein